jgi:hypothetical protein
MKHLITLLSATLLATTACRESPSRVTGTDNTELRKPVEAPAGVTTREHDDDFIQTRSHFETTARHRLDSVRAKLREAGTKTNAAARDAELRLRAEAERLENRLDTVDDRAEEGWDRFRSEVSTGLDRLEHEVDRLLY